MSDTKTGDEKTLSVNTKKTLTLKRPGMDQGTVRQNFSHGRIKQVVVETKKRKFARPEDKPEAAPAVAIFKPKPPVVVQAPVQEAPKPVVSAERSGVVLNQLSNDEMEARRRALEGSKVREVEERRRAAEDARRRTEEEERRRREREESARRQAEEEARLLAEAEAAPPRRGGSAPPRAADRESAVVEDDAEDAKRAWRARHRSSASIKPEPVKPVKAKGDEDRRRGKLTVTTALSDEDARARSLSSMRRRQEKFKRALHQEPREKIVREVILPETITIQELAQRMSERAVDVVKFFMKQGQIMKPGDVIDADTAELIASEFGHTVRRVSESDIEEGLFDVAGQGRRTCVRGRRSSPSWATSTTARPRCSTPSATPMSCRAKPAASPSTSAPTRSRRTARRSPSSTRPATPPSPRCAPAAPRRPTSPCWWSRPTTA